MKISNISHHIIEYSFYFLLFFVPLFITPLNYELFEYNKIMLTYALTIIIVGAWIIKMVSDRRFLIQRTPLDIPILLFLLSQVLSTFFSIDRHVSIWGYYSRFHGGLLSTIAYLTLYYAAVSNLNKENVIKALQFALLGGALVAAYGVAEHFGIDAQYWVQDVKNRVFSTLGQPNWLAAYLSILIPIIIAFGIQKAQNTSENSAKSASQISSVNQISRKVRDSDFPTHRSSEFSDTPTYRFLRAFWTYVLYLLVILFYLTLLYTKSRSGFTGFWAGNFILWAILFIQFRKRILKWFLIFNFSFLIFNFVIGSPFEQINKYFSLSAIREKITHVALPPSSPPPPGGTESGEIRKIVWKGAVDVWQHYPILGSGVETFAFSYYQYRPVEHNMVSEWDFLYNKAHNEYLNFLATTGALGLGSYLLLIFWFLGWNIKQFKIKNSQLKITVQNSKVSNYTLYPIPYTLTIALLAGYISILVSNFFGFSVVIVALFFFLIPAFSFILASKEEIPPPSTRHKPYLPAEATPGGGAKAGAISHTQSALTLVILFAICYTLYAIFRLWQADVYFAKGYNLGRIEDYSQAYQNLKTAIEINPGEPLYRDELSGVTVILAVQAAQEKDATQAAKLAREAIIENQKALEVSPNNVNFWKTRTRVFYTLAALNEDYNKDALEAIKKAWQLAPTDAKISYNLAVIYGRVGEIEMAKKTLEETIKLKPDYRDAHYALALYLKAEGKNEEAAEHLKYILEKISSEDAQAKELLGQPPQNPK